MPPKDTKINLTVDDDLRQFLIDTRAAKLAEVDAIEKLLGIDRTKDLRRVVKDLKHHETVVGYHVKDT